MRKNEYTMSSFTADPGFFIGDCAPEDQRWYHLRIREIDSEAARRAARGSRGAAVRWLSRMAGSEPAAAHVLAAGYLEGDARLPLFQAATAAGIWPAAAGIAECLLEKGDVQGAMEHLRPGVAAGCPLCLYRVACLCLDGREPGGTAAAIGLLERACTLGDLNAPFRLALVLLESSGGQGGQGRALDLLALAARRGHPEARAVAGLELFCRHERWRTLGRDLLYAEAGDGNADCARALAVACFSDGARLSVRRVAGLLERNSDDPGCARILGELVLSGRISGHAESYGVEMVRLAADAGDGRALGLYGSFCLAGKHGVRQDTGLAVSLFKKGVAAGDCDSLGLLGLATVNGLGLERQPLQGLAMLGIAAARGSAFAHRTLSSMDAQGAEFPLDEDDDGAALWH